MPIPGGTTPTVPVVAATLTRPCYTSRETVAQALDVKLTAYAGRKIDEAIAAGTGAVDKECHRTFTPTLATRTFDWPDRQSPTSWRLWLDDNELIRLDSIVAGGVTLDPADMLLYPGKGPPYNRIETDLSSSAVFTAGATHQQAVAITGLWGYQDDQAAAGALTGNTLADDTTIAVSDAVSVGIGDLLEVENERMLAVGRRSVDTGWTLLADLALSAAAITLPVTDGDLFTPGEQLAIDGERMRLDDIIGNTLVVKRAVDGSVLAAHTAGAAIYAGRVLQVVRAAAGTTAASHAQGTAITRHVPPALVSRYARAHALVTVLQDPAGWARTVGGGDNERQASGAGLRSLREELYDGYARKGRIR